MFVEVAIRNCVWWLRRANVTMLETKLNVWFRSNVHKLKKILQRSRQQGVCVFSFPLLFVVLLFFTLLIAVICCCCRLCPICSVRNVRLCVCMLWLAWCVFVFAWFSFICFALTEIFVQCDRMHCYGSSPSTSFFFLNMFVCVCVKGREKERIRIE